MKHQKPKSRHVQNGTAQPPAAEFLLANLVDGRDAGRMIRVVVIDDEELVAEACAVALRCTGHEVSVAHDGASGLRLIQEQLPDVVVSDIVMPDMDGRELAATLRATPAIAHIPVLLISGNTSPDDKTCDAFLPKPFVVRDLLDAVNRLATRRRKAI